MADGGSYTGKTPQRLLIVTQLAGYKRFIGWSNKTWQMGNPTQAKPQKGYQLLLN